MKYDRRFITEPKKPKSISQLIINFLTGKW